MAYFAMPELDNVTESKEVPYEFFEDTVTEGEEVPYELCEPNPKSRQQFVIVFMDPLIDNFIWSHHRTQLPCPESGLGERLQAKEQQRRS